ncbi:efflux RND transporter periplasmic adaptor subunit [Marinobacter sp.]|uniref:efflux RND transporter periplasmic adaptor subunit n=1 Tax=Marinobacter sp. TaxID=50741 RepID=UPI003A90EC94
MARKRSRLFLTVVTIVVLGAALSFAFWPRATKVDIGSITTDTMMVTIDEEGRTRVRDAYVISTPVAGRLLRVEVDPGDPVEKNETIVAQMRPTNPAVLDVRSREQARSAEAAANAALRLARAELNRAIADQELADTNLKRIRTLREKGTVSQAELDRAVHETRATQAAFDTAKAVIEVRQAELENARAQLMGFDDEQRLGTTGPNNVPISEIPIRAPISGQVLRIIQQSETTLPVGAAIMEVGNVDSDLEVLVELLSTDAVQVAPGDQVRIEKWGGPGALSATVARVDPWGFTKYSALGVEEQRVNTIIRFDDASPVHSGLGHGFRVEARIIVWKQDDALVVPSSALFREGQDWAVFLVEDDIAKLRRVDIGHNNGIQAQVLKGLESGDRVILFPASGLSDGMRVAQRESL